MLIHGRARGLGQLACWGIAHVTSRFVRCAVHIIRCSLLLHVAAGDYYYSRGLCPSFPTYYSLLISCFCVILSLLQSATHICHGGGKGQHHRPVGCWLEAHDRALVELGMLPAIRVSKYGRPDC
jgi:hypothetical protein